MYYNISNMNKKFEYKSLIMNKYELHYISRFFNFYFVICLIINN